LRASAASARERGRVASSRASKKSRWEVRERWEEGRSEREEREGEGDGEGVGRTVGG
jgi:hypothetical protein